MAEDGIDDRLAKVRKAQRDERRRVKDQIERDTADYETEIARAAAEAQVAGGNFANMSDTVVPPTPEWLEKHDHRPFRPKQPKGTVRTLKSVRRVVTPIVVRLQRAGKITDEQAAACLWYREQFDAAGLDGRFSSMLYSDRSTGNTSRKLASFAGHTPMTEAEAEARRNFRAASAALPVRWLKFFDAVVLKDKPLYRARSVGRLRNERVPHTFRIIAQKLVVHCEVAGVDLGSGDKKADRLDGN